MSNEFCRRVAVRVTDQCEEGSPPDSLELAFAVDPSAASEGRFAACVAGVVLGLRAAQETWGNGAWTGGDDVAEMAAHFAATIVERSLGPGEFWHWGGGDAEAEADGYGPRLAALRRFLDAAREVIRLGEKSGEAA